jgi:3D (Asp-Asp-Asp) domain-containing protein
MARRIPDSSSGRCPTLSVPAGGRQTLLAAVLLALLPGCALFGRGEPPAPEESEGLGERSLIVAATAYVAHGHGGRTPIGAWGDPLPPGTKALAVSQDLHSLGLVRGTRVRVEGAPGEWRVLDRMPKQWRRRIDLYMGRDRAAAVAWGRREVRIFWSPPRE